jgi:hypothetical protein
VQVSADGRSARVTVRGVEAGIPLDIRLPGVSPVTVAAAEEMNIEIPG